MHAERSELKLANIVWRRRWIALAVFSCALGGATSVMRFLPNVYRSTATVLVQREEVPEAFVRSAISTELETRINTISQEMLSRARLEEFIKRFGLYPSLTVEAAVERMRRDIHLELKSGDRANARPATVAFALSYVGTDPEIVATVTNTLASSYIEENRRIREGQAHGTAELLKVQLDATKRRLDEQGRQAGSFRQRYAGELPEQVIANLATLERLNTQLRLNGDKQIQAMERRGFLFKQTLAQDTSRAPVSSASSSESDVSDKRVAELKEELAQLRSRFTDKYPEVLRITTEIGKLEGWLNSRESHKDDQRVPAMAAADGPRGAQVGQEEEREIEAEISTLKDEEAALKLQMASYDRRIENAPQREQDLKDLSRDYASSIELYDSLRKRHEDALLAESMEQRRTGAQFLILDAAAPQAQPAAPNRRQILFLGAVLAFAMAAAAVVLTECIDTSFHAIDELRVFARVPILASVPRIDTRRDVWLRRGRFCLCATGAVVVLTLTVAAAQHLANENVELVRLLARSQL